jgi:multicomponent Na+:H+ antiporter subunit E
MRVFWWLSILLAAIWSLVYGEVSVRQFAIGFLISTTLLWSLRGYYNTGRKVSPAWVSRRFSYSLIYLVIFAKDLFLANIDLARRILHPRLDIHPGIVAVYIPTESDLEMTLVGSSITLTPGELVVDICPEKRVFYLHCVDARRPDAICRERLRYLNDYQGRIFR